MRINISTLDLKNHFGEGNISLSGYFFDDDNLIYVAAQTMCEHVSYNQTLHNKFPFIYRKCGASTEGRLCKEHNHFPAKPYGCSYHADDFICGHFRSIDAEYCEKHHHETILPIFLSLVAIANILTLMTPAIVFATSTPAHLLLLLGVIIITIIRWYIVGYHGDYTPLYCDYITNNSTGDTIRCLHQSDTDGMRRCHLHVLVTDVPMRCTQVLDHSEDRFLNIDGNPAVSVCGAKLELGHILCPEHIQLNKTKGICDITICIILESLRWIILGLTCWLVLTMGVHVWLSMLIVSMFAEGILVFIQVRLIRGLTVL